MDFDTETQGASTSSVPDVGKYFVDARNSTISRRFWPFLRHRSVDRKLTTIFAAVIVGYRREAQPLDRALAGIPVKEEVFAKLDQVMKPGARCSTPTPPASK